MAAQRDRNDAERLAAEIRRNLTASQLGISEQAFTQLSQNIARAIQMAVTVSTAQAQEPDFGEMDRATGE